MNANALLRKPAPLGAFALGLLVAAALCYAIDKAGRDPESEARRAAAAQRFTSTVFRVDGTSLILVTDTSTGHEYLLDIRGAAVRLDK